MQRDRLPRAGAVVRLGRAASIQFALAPILFRVIRVHDWNTYDGWAWIDGYELNNRGDAVVRRSVFIQVNGIQQAHFTLSPPPVPARGTTNRAKPTSARNPRGNGPRSNDPRGNDPRGNSPRGNAEPT
jgi:hypothetical protein